MTVKKGEARSMSLQRRDNTPKWHFQLIWNRVSSADHYYKATCAKIAEILSPSVKNEPEICVQKL